MVSIGTICSGKWGLQNGAEKADFSPWAALRIETVSFQRLNLIGFLLRIDLGRLLT